MLVAIVPFEADGVLSYRRRLGGLGGGFEHGQLAWLGFWGLADAASTLAALLVAEGAGTSVTQPHERVMALMAVFPGDIHSRAGGYIHLHGFGIGPGITNGT